MTRSLVSPALRRAMIAHAQREAPRECCGLLLGRRGRVDFVLPIRNAARLPRTRFRISDRDHIAARRWLRQLSPPLEIVGAYHSHPDGPATPSASDVAESHYPDWIHAIVGLGAGLPRVALYRIRQGRARRVG